MVSTEQWLVQVRKGVVELLILRLLRARSELHGYAIAKELPSFGSLIAGESTIYPILKRLEADGLLVSRWVETSAAPPRKYYALSDAGTAFLEAADREWAAIIDSMARVEREGPT